MQYEFYFLWFQAKKIEQHERKKQMKKEEKELKVKKEHVKKAKEARAKAAKEEAAHKAMGGDTLGGFPMPNLDDLFDDDFEDPEVSLAYMDVSSNPANLPKYQNNPKVMKFYTKFTKKLVPGGDPDMVEALNDPELCLAYFDLVNFPANLTKYKNNPKVMKMFKKMEETMPLYCGGGCSMDHSH